MADRTILGVPPTPLPQPALAPVEDKRKPPVPTGNLPSGVTVIREIQLGDEKERT